jgi:hypothetical protein
MVSVEIQPMVAHFEEGSKRNLQKEEISLMNLHTIFPNYRMKWLTMTMANVERCQTLIQSQFNIQSCAALPCIAKLK